MREATYAAEAAIEETHWWFVGRRRLFGRELGGAKIPPDARILDVGTGTGSNLRMLRDLRYSAVEGLDPSEEAVRWCAAKGLGRVRQGSICNLPFADESFDAVLATDVIEHVEDDGKALSELARIIRPGGTALITVPAFPALWGLQDDVALHRRRYRLRPLVRLALAAGLAVVRAYHFNYLLFIPIWGARQVMRLARSRLESEGQVRGPIIDRLLSAIFTLDILTAPRLRPPFGVSILILAIKPAR
ncbi:MAG: methyltransferase domain-containing protein [Acetobacteraceae bacterium]